MFDNVLQIVRAASSKLEPVVDENASPKAIVVHPDDLLPVCRELFMNSTAYFDLLSCITGIDNGPAMGTIEIAYNLYSIPYDLHLTLKIAIPRDGGEVDSVAAIWKTANWHEREIFDMFGVGFRNHPDLRRILMPADWEGHPLRKDYKQAEYYKKIKVDY